MAHEFKCTIAGCDNPNATRGYDRPQDLGRHKYFAHNIAGKSTTAIYNARDRKARKFNKSLRTHDGRIVTAAGRKRMSDAQKRRWKLRDQNQNEQNQITENEDNGKATQLQIVVAGLFGAITEKISNAAQSAHLPFSDVANGIAELFHQTRNRLRNPMSVL